MPGEVRAVIDVGTNSVKLLVADVRSGNNVVPLHESSQQTRLGQGFYESHTLQPGAIDLTAKAVADFVNEAQRWQPARIKIVGTSAARDAASKGDQAAMQAMLNAARENGVSAASLNAAQRVIEDYIGSQSAEPEQVLDDEIFSWLARVIGHDLHLYRGE